MKIIINQMDKNSIKFHLDNATFNLVKGIEKHAYSKVQMTDRGFVYTVDFEKDISDRD